jgi:hypothetical protein
LLIKSGIIANSAYGYYDVRKMQNEIKNDPSNIISMYVKYDKTHVGYYKTSGETMYMQDWYVDFIRKTK